MTFSNDTVADKPAANPWGMSWNFKYSLHSLGRNLNTHSEHLQRCMGVLCVAHIWTKTCHTLFDFYKILFCYTEGQWNQLIFCGNEFLFIAYICFT